MIINRKVLKQYSSNFITDCLFFEIVTKLKDDKNADIAVLKQVPKPGRNTRADKGLLRVLKRILRQDPTKAGGEAKKWTGNLLSVYLKEKYNIELKPRVCQRWMRRFELEQEGDQKLTGKMP